MEKWFKTEQIETWVGPTDNGENKEIGYKAKLVILHQCGENKEWLINQLKIMIDGMENGFDAFAG